MSFLVHKSDLLTSFLQSVLEDQLEEAYLLDRSYEACR